jgi:hypothetical protein
MGVLMNEPFSQQNMFAEWQAKDPFALRPVAQNIGLPNL